MDQDRNYYLKLTWISLLLFGAVTAYYYLAPSFAVSKTLLYIVPFFLVINLTTRFVSRKIEKKASGSAKLFYLAVSGIKFIFYIAILLLYGVFIRVDIPHFFIGFLLFYLIYTWLDVHYLLRTLSG